MTKRVGNRSPSPIHYPRGHVPRGSRSRGNRPPYPTTTYPYPARNRGAEIITISLLVAAFMLLGLGGMLWIVQSRLAFGPTPTPTPTARPPFTATPDYLSTRVAEDFLTQQAYQMALLGTQTSTPQAGTPTPPSDDAIDDNPLEATNTPVIVLLPGLNAPFTPTPTETLVVPEEFPTDTPTANIVNLPIVVDNSPLATPTPAQVAEVPVQEVPVQEPPTPVEPSPTPVEIPTETPTPTAIPEQPTPTPTATETLPPPSPTPSPTSTLIAPGQPFVVGSLQGFVQERRASLYVGPSTIYERVNELEPGTRVTILRRNPSGEWLYICCVENQPDQAPVWVRQAFVRPRDNQLQNGAPEGSNPNDVRWLTIEPAPAHLTPLPTLVPPGPDDYPLYHYDRHASRRVDQLPLPPLNGTWLDAERGIAGLGLVSPVAVVGNSVLVGSADNHLYNFERPTGSQRWRRNLCEDGCRNVSLAPTIYDNEIFLADQNRTVWALGDIANGAGPTTLWRVTLAQPAITSFNVFSETIYLGTGEGGSHTLLALDRDNGAIRWQKPVTGPGLRYPAIGDQLIYAADSSVAAYDLHTGELVWENTDVLNVIADPVYGSPGPSSLAELYVFTNNNRIYALDANTGVELWNIDNGQSATALALNQDTLFVAGDNYLKAISRQDRTQRWLSPLVGGQVMGGPLVDATRALVVTQAGNLHMFENQSGAAIPVPSIASFVAGAPAVSGAYIFIPGIDGRLYALIGNRSTGKELLPMSAQRKSPTHGLPANASSGESPTFPTPVRPGWDALLVALLTVATLQINGFAQSAALPTRVADVMRHPWLGGLLPEAGLAAMGEIGPIPGDPVGLLLNALTLLALLAYLVADQLGAPRRRNGLKWIALTLLIVMALVLPTVKLILFRDQSGPASYTHDGGVIQTEATIAFFLSGKNPYVEDYVDTPMAEWGFSEFRTALYHYPYLPWTFVFSAPFYLVGQMLGHYDQRWLYLTLIVVALLVAPQLARRPRAQFALVAALALNPVMNLDITFGQNDVFVFCWMLFSLVAWHRWRACHFHSSGWLLISTVCYGLACASKPTAWFFAPFYALLLLADQSGGKLSAAKTRAAVQTLLARGWPALAAFLVLIGPYALWDPAAFYDDVWRWSNGQGETGYQIWGWGASNFVLALGWVSSRFEQWPFLILEALIALPLLAWFVRRQWQHNTLSMACWHYALFLFAFFYGSRFLNENYLGFILAFLAVGLFSDENGEDNRETMLEQTQNAL